MLTTHISQETEVGTETKLFLFPLPEAETKFVGGNGNQVLLHILVLGLGESDKHLT